MSFSILKRNDHLNPLNTYLYIYDTKPLYLMEDEYRKNILRIVKKSILGTNFTFLYSKHNAFISAIINFIIINTCFVIFPQLLFHSKDIENLINEIVLEGEEIQKINKSFSLLSKKSSNFIIRLFSNLIDSIILIALTINYRYKENIINRFMEKYTQCSIEIENKLLENKYNCKISNDGNFNIIINLEKNNNISYSNIYYNNKYFFEYVINFPNLKYASNYLYKKIFLPKEKEIINRIDVISNEIENKYKKKLLKFLFIIITILLCLPLLEYVSDEKKIDILNYFGILSLSLFVQRKIFLNNKSEQIKNVSSLNKEYINDGYYIYINNDIISIFYLKEEYRNIESINKITELNQIFIQNLKN